MSTENEQELLERLAKICHRLRLRNPATPAEIGEWAYLKATILKDYHAPVV